MEHNKTIVIRYNFEKEIKLEKKQNERGLEKWVICRGDKQTDRQKERWEEQSLTDRKIEKRYKLSFTNKKADWKTAWQTERQIERLRNKAWQTQRHTGTKSEGQIER